MRPRFTIRLAVVAITLFGAACYVLFVRPSDVAYRCIQAINNRDYFAARSLLGNDRPSIDFFDPLRAPSATFVYAEALPREWQDIWSFQRRFIFRVGWKDMTNGRHVEWVEDRQLVAFIDGVEMQRE